ncbi:hypothetical protein [Acinetobacter lanii]|uniref:Uncharacterized protein n=1 Tax=Acinetobacter lanii TaxID=2715163 RepID=A0A6G8S1G3_9GAMM|nr:hypothetical protein [Acinetobacter lanii]QIO07954.1 hypothetical protein G8D99_02235 [Acinetobacter lanii]
MAHFAPFFMYVIFTQYKQIKQKKNFLGEVMKFSKLVLCLSLTSLISACGGGDGYYEKQNTTDSGDYSTTTDTNETKFFEDHIHREGSVLFGELDINNSITQKGYIDHALDTFGNGILKLAIDVHSKFNENKTEFIYYEDCHADRDETPASEATDLQEKIIQGCYVIHGEKLKNLLGNKYINWNFNVKAADLANLQPKESLESYIGETSVIIYENQNADKNLNNIVVTGKFGYPYLQSWGLKQTEQIRFVNIPDADGSTGGFNIYNDPTYKEGEFYVIQADSSYSVITNDNPATPNIEPVTLTVGSVPGRITSSFTVNTDGSQILDLPNVSAVTGQRIDNQTPSTNTKSISGSIYLSGPNVLNFLEKASAVSLNYKHNLTLQIDNKSITRTLTNIK